MKITGILFFLSILINDSLTADTTISCSDLKKIKIVGSIFLSMSSKQNDEWPVTFYLATSKKREPTQIGATDWSAIRTSEFDLSQRTYIIVHGYNSGGRKSWVINMKERLLDFEGGNVIMVDWSLGSNTKNYINAARNTRFASNKIFNFLQALRAQIDISRITAKQLRWNHLYFIGHSLGAQVSGQTAHILKEDNFWRLDRITGLDPAKPCFQNIDLSMRIDKEDADFVDIIHTQAGAVGNIAFGLKDNIGHIDFYVNAGIVQPQCVGSKFTPSWNTMICSHKLAYKYFTQSLINSINGNCTFSSYSWNGSYQDALRILNEKLDGITCKDCPEMGINAFKSKYTQSGTFLVLTSEEEPYCELKETDLKNLIKVIDRLKGSRNIFQQ